jgi:hypothetical protein
VVEGTAGLLRLRSVPVEVAKVVGSNRQVVAILGEVEVGRTGATARGSLRK